MPPTKEEVAKAKKDMLDAYSRYVAIREPYLKAEKEWMEKCKVHQALDKALAMVDGRYHKISLKQKEEKPIAIEELTLAQIEEVAKALNIDLSEVDDEGIATNEPLELAADEILIGGRTNVEEYV